MLKLNNGYIAFNPTSSISNYIMTSFLSHLDVDGRERKKIQWASLLRDPAKVAIRSNFPFPAEYRSDVVCVTRFNP